MIRKLVSFLIACVLTIPLLAQRGTAPNGYYPAGYAGAIFTGTHEATKDNSQELTLVFTKGTKSERFVGRLEAPCSVKRKDGTVSTFEPSGVTKGLVLTAYYRTVTKKADGQKIKENSIFAISIAEADGKKIPDANRVILYCTEETYLQFKAF